MKTQRIIHPNIDIRKFPEVNADFSMTDISMGDLHANALLFLNILVRQGIIAISPENYAKFAEIYTLPELQADYWGPKHLFLALEINRSVWRKSRNNTMH